MGVVVVGVGEAVYLCWRKWGVGNSDGSPIHDCNAGDLVAEESGNGLGRHKPLDRRAKETEIFLPVTMGRDGGLGATRVCESSSDV